MAALRHETRNTKDEPSSLILHPSPITGVLPIDKPQGITSHDVVNRVRRLFGIRRVGHAGTLDPLATGVLVLCIGPATRIIEYLAAGRKEYVAGVVFGVTTDTEDSTGNTLSESDTSGLTEETVRGALVRFRGRIEQTPPMVSAVHHEGKRLYELARKGIEVEREPRDVEIHRLELLSFTPGGRARAVLEVECSSGTYIRTLAADIGKAVDDGAMMDSLRRTRVGRFTLDDCPTLDGLTESANPADALLPIAEALSDLPRIALDSDDSARIAHGQSVAGGEQIDVGATVLLVNYRNEALAIARAGAGDLTPVKVLVGSAPE